jgi:membrane-associated phospholipid phosphatase
LVVEVTVFLSVTLAIDRPRPAVPHLDSAPPTSSFPSGHTAAAMVLFAGIALIAMCCTRSWVLRAASVVVAVVIPVTVGAGRVYRGMHAPTDVFAGALLGVGSLIVAVLAVRAASAREEVRHERANPEEDHVDARRRLASAHTLGAAVPR